jgi:diketogulonate reductase-like aldo/keto reductase
MKNYVLRSKYEIPSIGCGTWEISPNEKAEKIVAAALDIGYRVIDTARIYGNELGVGNALRHSGISRTELFITTKLWNDDQGYERTLQACQKSMRQLKLDYLDLYLIHWPTTSKRFESWRAIEKLRQDGSIKFAGVSNFTIRHIHELLDISGLRPDIDQVEFHPFIYEQQKELLAFCKKYHILIEAYSPLQRISAEQNKPINEIAKSHGKSPQQIVLRWCLQHDTLPLVRSTNKAHLRSNFEIYDFELNSGEMSMLNSLSDGRRVTWDPGDMR